MHVFISYARDETRELAMQIYDAVLALPDVTVWVDASYERPADWQWQIEAEIHRCDVMVVLISPDVNRHVVFTDHPNEVMDNIRRAQNLEKHLVPLLAQPTAMPELLAETKPIDLTRNPSRGIRQVVEHLQSITSDYHVRQESSWRSASHQHNVAEAPSRRSAQRLDQRKAGQRRQVWLRRSLISLASLLIFLMICGLLLFVYVRLEPVSAYTLGSSTGVWQLSEMAVCGNSQASDVTEAYQIQGVYWREMGRGHSVPEVENVTRLTSDVMVQHHRQTWETFFYREQRDPFGSCISRIVSVQIGR